MASVLRQRRDTAANWSVKNPIIPDGQLCFDTSNNTFRIGDGTTNYNSLLIQSGTTGATGATGPSGGPTGPMGPSGIDGADGADGSGSGDLLSTNNLSDLSNVTTSRSNLGLIIGTDVQAFDATIMVDADIGTTVQAYDATIVVDADIGVNVQAYDTDTSKIDVAEIRTANIDLLTYSETKIAISANSVNLSLGNVFTKTISGATTLTFDNPPASGKAGAFSLILTNGASSAITWPGSVDWPLATPPTLTAAGVDVLTFTTIDGGTIWYGIASGIGMA